MRSRRVCASLTWAGVGVTFLALIVTVTLYYGTGFSHLASHWRLSTTFPIRQDIEELPHSLDLDQHRANVDDDTPSCRKEPWNRRKLRNIRKNLLSDNYSFCVKIVPFLGPYPYTNTSLNPCWYQQPHQRLRCLPAFYLAGFSKSGTSDLFAKMIHHPQIIKGESKEFHWFDYQRYFQGQDSIESYTMNFNSLADLIQRDIQHQGYSKKITGEFTPSYIWSSLYWRCYHGNQGLEEPKFTIADIIHHLHPKAKIIISLRNPIDRLYSRFLSWVGYDVDPAYLDPSPKTFHNLVTRAVKLYQACFLTWSPRHCAYNGTLYKLTRLRLQEGMYSIFLVDWLQVFPKDQLLFIRFEDYAQDVPNHLQRIFRFLGIDTVTKSQLQTMSRTGLRNKGEHYDVGPMMNATRRLLESFYRPYLASLPNLTGSPNMVWY